MSSKALREYLNQVAPGLGKTTQKDFNEIDLTLEEEQEALRRAREEKFYAQRRAEYWTRISSEPEINTYTTAELIAKLTAAKVPSGKTFVIDNDNREIITIVCQYFANDPEFEQDGRSLKKGLALLGNLGVGKTFLMGFFHQNQNQSYVMQNCRKIEGLWVDQMSAKDKPLRNVIDMHSTAITASVNTNPFGHKALGACFDDLGTETVPSKAYGEEKKVMFEILMNRYESGLPFNYTHITTNLSAHEIGLKYDTRLRDRCREMFNLINFDKEAKSRRV